MVLVFDTETTVDPSQRLRVMFYQLYKADRQNEEAAAYDPAALSTRELATLRAYCTVRGLPQPMTLEAFREVFLQRAYDCGAEVVGFNLPFDLARIAIDASPARVTKWRRKMRGGFTFKLSEDRRRPHLQVRLLGPRSAVFEFTAEYRQRTGRPDRKRDEYVPVHRGHFTDVRTLASALTSRSHSLKSLTQALGTPTQKSESDEHGGELSFQYLDYARADVQATWECFAVLRDRHASYGLRAGHWEVLSEASLGKATLSALGIKSWLSLNPNPSPQLLAKIMCSYFGGRTEVRWRKTVRQVFHTDFTSMYPTVCTLMGLWRFVIATDFETRDATEETRALLAEVTADDLQDPAFWPRLTTLVRVRPDRDLYPVRAPYCRERNATIGLNDLSADDAIWFTLADCIVAKINGSKTPVIEEAIGFAPGPQQEGLTPIKLMGGHVIDPRKDDLFRRLIQLRIAEKGRAGTLHGSERAAADELSKSLKILANASSYGIFMQVNVDTETDPVPVEVFGPDGSSFITKSRKVEQPGPFFHPLLATGITGAARLMLALAENRATVEGLDWVFCDTDSLALARPDGMSEEQFLGRAHRVLDWFQPLDPYGVGRSILKAEDANFSLEYPGQIEPLYCLAISSKRYVLFNIAPNGEPKIRKGSAHGLGHLRPPYEADDPAADTGGEEAADDDLPQWQHDLWHKLVQAALKGDLDGVRYDYHPKLRQPARSRYAATSPELWRWFAPYNDGRAYADRVKPFGFLYALHARPGAKVHPIAPYDRTVGMSIRKAFCRVTRVRVPVRDLQTYAEALAGYHLSPESKFRNGEAFDAGRTERRHVRGIGVEFIGKEADRYEEAFLLGLGEDPTVRYGPSTLASLEIHNEVAAAAQAYGDSVVGKATGLPRSTVAKLRNGITMFTRSQQPGIRESLRALVAMEEEANIREAAALDTLRDAIGRHGSLRAAARALGLDPSNMSKRLRR